LGVGGNGPAGVPGGDDEGDVGGAGDFTGGPDTGNSAAAIGGTAVGGKQKSSFEFGGLAASLVGKSALAQRLETSHAARGSKEAAGLGSSRRRSSLGDSVSSLAKGLLSSLVMTQVTICLRRAHLPFQPSPSCTFILRRTSYSLAYV
jgi:hypothetical protein